MVDHIISLCRAVKPIPLACQLSLPQLAAVIGSARLFIGGDSAPTHMAAALDTPSGALDSPTKLQRWRPWSEKSTVLWACDYAELPDPDTIDTQTRQSYLSAIPLEPVLTTARGHLSAPDPLTGKGSCAVNARRRRKRAISLPRGACKSICASANGIPWITAARETPT